MMWCATCTCVGMLVALHVEFLIFVCLLAALCTSHAFPLSVCLKFKHDNDGAKKSELKIIK